MKLKRANSYALHALMYMVRHITQSPLTLQAISKSEGIPYRHLVSLFHTLSDAGIVTNSTSDGYVFKKPPSEISLLELFELVEGHPLFDECFLKHADCLGTTENCSIYASWKRVTQMMSRQLAEISIDKAAWSHPEHLCQQCCLGIETVQEDELKSGST